MRKTADAGAGRQVVLTDCPQEARLLQETEPVIGICSPGTRDSWSGISFVAENWEAVDEAYARLAYCRYYGLPVVLTEGEGWRVREAGVQDAEAFLALYEDEAVKKYLPYPMEERTKDPKDWKAWIQSLHRYVYPSEEPAMWVLADSADQMMGRIGLEWRDADGQFPEGYYLGYALLPRWRKKGLAAKAASQLVSYCVEYWQLDRVFLLCESDNTASVKTALNSGFSCCGAVEKRSGDPVSDHCERPSGLQDIIQHGLNLLPGICSGQLLLFTRQ